MADRKWKLNRKKHHLSLSLGVLLTNRIHLKLATRAREESTSNKTYQLFIQTTTYLFIF